MKNLYGYTEKDVRGLLNYIKNNKNKPLTQNFYDYAKSSNKAKGTIRNLYYAIVKASNEDSDFCKNYTEGIPIKAGEIEKFSDCEEKELIKKILINKYNGKSVRKSVNELAGGDSKLALRYQNKYRNAVKNDKKSVLKIINDLNEQGMKIDGFYDKETVKVNTIQFLRLKQEIDSLVDRISENVRKENEKLKQRICILETENYRLRKGNYRELKGALNYFLPISTYKSQNK